MVSTIQQHTYCPQKPDFAGLAGEPVRIDPSNRRIGHEGATMRKIGKKYVHFGTAWSTDQGRKGSYNLYYCTSDKITGPYSERRFVGRFLGHGTPFRTKTANGGVLPSSMATDRHWIRTVLKNGT